MPNFEGKLVSFAPLTPQSVMLPSGVTLNYVRAGRGPVVIMIHGAMGDYRSWGPQWDAFTAKYDCVSYSRRYSFPNPNPMEVRDHSALVEAVDLEQLMDALKIDEAILLGSSYGGFTALAAALRMPDRVRAIVAVEPPMMRYAERTDTGGPVVADFLRAHAHPARDAFARGDNEEGARLLTGGIVGKVASHLPAHVMQQRMQNIDGARSLALSDDEFPWLEPEALAALTQPILLMSGENTALVHAEIFKAVTAAMPQAEALIAPDSGHSVSRQNPDFFNATALAFLADAGMESAPEVA